jgi:spermidine synthase
MIENKLYKNNIIYTEQTPYQKIVVTSTNHRIQFYINGAIQFDSIDEHRYHESLVHPAMMSAKAHENILIIGGGDGMALREVLKYKDVQMVKLVDLDPIITTLFTEHKDLSALNSYAYRDKRVRVLNQDAWKFIEEAKELFDVIILDLPDPNNISLSRLYSQTFYQLLKNKLSKSGVMVTQASSPLFTQKAFWSIKKSMEYTGLYVKAYHTYVPSFGEWGFVLGSNFPINLETLKPMKGLKYLNEDILKRMPIFAPDISEVDVEVNKLSTHRLIEYYDEGWKKWYE